MAVAAAHVGSKRSHQDMLDANTEIRPPVPPQAWGTASAISSRLTSREPTPSRTGRREDATARWPRVATFEPSISIVLIGIRGVGKSTLGILAATAYGRRIIDTDKAFLEATGNTTTAYRKLKGTAEYQRRHNQILEDTLRTYNSDTVIVCSFSDLEHRGATLIREYGKTHPIILITRTAEEIQSHLQLWSVDRIKELLAASTPLLRSCSNFEFFNLSEREDEANGIRSLQHALSENSGPNSAIKNFLTLKRAERDFLRLLRNAIGDRNRGPSHRSAYPLSNVRIEDREHTFRVSVSVSDILGNELDLDEMQIGADCVELTMDVNSTSTRDELDDIAIAFATLRRATILPILMSPKWPTSRPSKGEHAMLEIINQCLRLGPEMLTVDLSLDATQIRQVMLSRGSARVIGSQNFPARLSDGFENKQAIEAYKRGAELGCTIVEITMPAESVEDACTTFGFKHAVQNLDVTPPLIAYSTGLKGRLSQCLNKILKPVVPHSFQLKADPEDEATGEALSARAITNALFSSFALDPLEFFIFGADVDHSLSPGMHNPAYKACGMRYNCSTFSSDQLDDFLQLTRGHRFGGTAVAHPFKTIVPSILGGLSRHARAIGAVNSVIPVRRLDSNGGIPNELAIIAQRREEGPVKALYGFNTDWIGVRACIRRGLSPANTVRPYTSALICGAGGMARAATYSLLSLGVQNIFVCNRTLTNAVNLVEHYKSLMSDGTLSEVVAANASQIRIEVLESFASPWPSDMRQPTIIINCIPRLDDDHSTIEFSLPETWLKSPTGGVVLEVAYRLPVSPFFMQIRERATVGWIALDGWDFLPEQAYSQFELFTGRRAPRKLMREEILKHASFD